MILPSENCRFMGPSVEHKIKVRKVRATDMQMRKVKSELRWGMGMWYVFLISSSVQCAN